MPLQIRRGTNAERQAMVQPLAAGELLYVTDDQRLYIGTGAALGGVQITGYNNEDAQDAAASLFTSGVHSGISFSYNDASNRVDATINLSTYTGAITATSITAGTITAGALKGTVVADDSTILVDGVSGVLRGQLIGTVTGTVTGSLVGSVVGNTTGYHTGDVSGSIFGANSSVIVDGTNNVVVGDVVNINVTTENISAEVVTIDRNLASGGLAIRTQGDTQLDNYDLFNIVSANSSSNGNFATFSKARGTIASPSALQTNDGIFSLLFIGHATSDFEVAAGIEASIDGSVGSFAPGKLSFQTSDTSGNVTSRLTIDSKGTSAFTGMMQLATFADETAANAAVGGSPVNGMMYYDSGAGKIKGRQGGAWVVLQA
jgi:hypothetical protein